MATLTVIKFKGLTDRTGKSNYLAGSTGSNEFQSANTPYEATYQINFNNESSSVLFYPTQGNLIGSQVADDISLVARYKITRVFWSLNKSVVLTYDASTKFIAALSANYRNFQVKHPLNNFMDINYEMPVSGTTLGGETPLGFTLLQTGTTGIIQFTINYFDKYIMPSGF